MSTFRNDTAMEAKAIELGFTYYDDTSGSVTLKEYSPYPVQAPKQRSNHVLSTIPGASSSVALSHGSWVDGQGIGWGSTKHKKILEIAKAGGIKTLLCTVNNTNWAQISILVKNGWRGVTSLTQDSSLWKKDLD